ncbi:MAG: potassium-transporting ATPase subunit KdpA [Sphingobacteriia bacterium]|jgi:K+-transporting ATPase ATPase A chain
MLYLSLLLLLAVTTLLAYPLGRYMARVYRGERTLLDFLTPLERRLLRLAGIDPAAEHSWQKNLLALLVLNGLFFLWALVILMVQASLPLNPDGIPNMPFHQAFNTAISFMTNTNLQHYSGETGASYFTQLLVFCYLQFVSAATGMAALVLVMRAITQSRNGLVGNFYVFFLKSATRILLPLAILLAVALLVDGVPATLEGAAQATTLEGATQTIARGPSAPMVAIKQLGTNGGGYFGPNSAHPLENPTVTSNLLEWMAILLLPMAMVFAFGRYIGRPRLGWMLYGVMMAGYLCLLLPTVYQEVQGNAALAQMDIYQPDGSMEGKESRFGPGLSALWGVTTTCTSNGSVNAMHDSFTALSGTFLLLGMMVNAFWGGVGVGLLNMYVFVVLAVFMGGLMIGRTPELWGKKLEPREIKLAALVFLLHPLLILLGTGLAAHIQATQGDATGWLANPGYHGFSEMLYEMTSSSANNGSGFEGLGDNTPFWNYATGIIMLLARFLPIIGPVAIGGLLAAKQTLPETGGSLRTDNFTFGLLLFFVVLILSALAFFPALALGPVAEYLTLI